MKLLFVGLTLLAGLFSFSPGVRAQCSYPLTLTTGNNYCIGSTLRVSSTHALETIVWYLNDQPVYSVKARQSLSTNGITVAGGHGDGGNLNQIRPESVAVDDAGNVYVANPDGADIRKWPPGAGSGISVAQIPDPADVYVDTQGNLYADNVHGHCVYRVAAGTNTAVLVGTMPIAPHYLYAFASGLWVDCTGNVYLGDGESGNVYKFAPGDTSAVMVASPTRAHPYFDIISICLDASGNLFISSSQDSIMECTPGDTNSIRAAAGWMGASVGGVALGWGPIWVDGLDTIYVADNGYDGTSASRILKWAPGASTPTLLLGGQNPGSGVNQFGNAHGVTMDSKGNIYVADLGNYRVQKFTRTSSIDSTYTPNEPGKLYAVVTDMRGYSETTDTIYINDPNLDPSIQIKASASSTPVCTPITFYGSSMDAGAGYRYQWEVNGLPVGGDTLFYTYNLFANGDQVDCILETAAGCTGRLQFDTSNIITLQIDPQGSATVAIAASDSAICQGVPVAFNATVANGSTQPTFEWLLNGNPITGDDSSAYHTDTLNNDDLVTCIITSDDACGLAKSNSIRVLVSPPPTIGPNQVFNIQFGQSLTLDPSVTGNISSWLWTPGAGLSDSTIPDPIATPAKTTDYKLKVVSAGCGSDSGYILVNVYTPLSIPNAFTPNGDGHNDIFYVLGGPLGATVEDFSVYNRWGQSVFHAHSVDPGDPSGGWNGYLHGQPAPPGTYVYQVVMRFGDGSRQVYKGTVILIR
jgi:gliding motility-associated-like protein